MLKKIGFKLIFAVGVAMFIIVGIYAYTSIESQSEVLFNEVERHVNQLGETVVSSTRYEMLLNNRSHISEIIHTVGKQPFIHEVRIVNKDGVTIYSSDSTAIGQMVNMKTEACYACHSENQPLEVLPIPDRTRIYRIDPDSSRLMGIINAIYSEPSCWKAACHVHPAQQKVLGVLDITISLQTIDQQIQTAKFKIAIFGLIAILALSTVLWIVVKIWVDRPVNTLVAATQQVASGNLNYTIQDLGNDELGALARSFNNMTQKLSEARYQLLQSDKMVSLGRLAAGVAHEINNPLTGILTYSSYLLKRSKNNPEVEADLEVIVRETKRSREIVKGLLDFARQSVPKKTQGDINKIIDRALSVIENQLTIRHIQLNKNFADDLPDVLVDENQIQQVFINLIDNAAFAIGESGGRIIISTALIRLAPFGITQIKHATCPKGHDLMDPSIKIDGMPSIHIKARNNGNEGFINLNPIYGKNENYYGISLDKKSNITLYCPRCDISLVAKEKTCPRCDSPIYTFDVPSKGKFEGCTNKECSWQYWEVVESEGDKEYIEIKVSDTGCGISQENLQKIFDPFFTTKGQKGNGLGLAVAWGIVDNHNGTIIVESKVAKGTTFTIRLPSVKR